MKKRPEFPRLAAGLAIAAALAWPGAADAQDLAEETLKDWYRVELLVFLREDADALASERWDALPALAYPGVARFLIDPGLADRRVEESSAYGSTIDAGGIQHLLLPGAFSPLDGTERPDSLILEPYEAPVPELLEGAVEGEVEGAVEGTVDSGVDGIPAGADDSPGAQAATGDPADPSAFEGLENAAPRVALAAPFQLLSIDTLDFRAEARSLRRRGHRVAFHGAWWMYLPPDETVPALYLDRGADPDDTAWPDLQGSVRIDRSRYLHIDVDLWLNTLAGYLPEGWQIDAPPLPPASIVGQTLTGAALNPWAPPPQLPVALPGPDRAPTLDRDVRPEAFSSAETATMLPPAGAETVRNDSDLTGQDEELEPPYPWRHAIVHRQSRRMRSDEVHYLDHPVIGVVVKLRPAGEDLMPVSSEEDIAFRERHGLPIEYVEPAETEGAGG